MATAKKTKKVSKKQLELIRKARNAYSLQWKREHQKQVKEWNRKWYVRQCEAARKAA